MPLECPSVSEVGILDIWLAERAGVLWPPSWDSSHVRGRGSFEIQMTYIVGQ